MKSVAFGQYYPAKSFVHGVDPRTKVILAVIYIVCTFLCKSLIAFLALVASAVLLVLWEPTAVTDPSFLLSFLSTCAILTVAVPLCDAVQRRFSSPRRKGFFSRLYEGTVIFFYSSFLLELSYQEEDK